MEQPTEISPDDLDWAKDIQKRYDAVREMQQILRERFRKKYELGPGDIYDEQGKIIRK